MLLQERIEELESGILNIKNNQVEVIGFLSPERLNDYYEKGIQCFYSKEFYPNENLNFNKIKDNALFVVIKDNKEISRYQFNILIKDTIKFKAKNKDGKTQQFSRVYTIRKSNFDDIYNYKDSEVSLIFNTIDELKIFFNNKFNTKLKI